MCKTETRLLKPCGGTPNSVLPLVLVRGAWPGHVLDGAAACGRLAANGWSGNWVYTVFDFWHFHTRGHEVLAGVSGRARIGFGGEGGMEADFGVGDICVIPAGVGHRRIDSTDDFRVAGGYPPMQEGNIVRPGEMVDERLRREIDAVPMPETDPVSGDRNGVPGW